MKELWNDFLKTQRYQNIIINDTDLWESLFFELKKFIDLYNRLPSLSSSVSSSESQQQFTYSEETLSQWLLFQLSSYQNKSHLMSNSYYFNIWRIFIIGDKYSLYFFSKEQLWCMKMELLKQYMDTHNELPKRNTTNVYEQILMKWLSTQIKEYGINI